MFGISCDALGIFKGILDSNIDKATDSSMIDEAVKAAKAADVAVAVVGDSAGSCGESFDRSTLDLPGGQLDLLKALAGTGKPLVVVLIGCRTATFGADGTNF